MSEETIWGQGYCEKHNRYYAALIDSGCPVCESEEKKKNMAEKKD